MATDADRSPDRIPDLRAGGILDLSTGGPAPPPPEPRPRPPVTPDPDVRVGKALDLSRKGGESTGARRSRASDSLGHGPVVRETVDLSTQTVEPPQQPPARQERRPDSRPEPSSASQRPDSSQRPGGSRPQSAPRSQTNTPRGVAPKSASSSLADLLDPEVLARLRGGG